MHYKKLSRFSQSLGASVTPPILVSNTFSYSDAAGLDNGKSLIYARQSNPASYMLEYLMADMDEGVDAMAFSSGMAAVTTLFMSLKKGQTAIVPSAIYWPVRHWVERFSQHFHFSVRWVDDISASTILEAIDENTKLIWVELIGNPSLNVTDIKRIAELKPPSVTLAVDATCVTPAICRSLSQGADIVMYSGSKCLGGHNDLMAGVLVTREETEYWATIRDMRWLHGNGLGAMDSSQLCRSLMTLAVRMKQSSASALRIAQALVNHPSVESVVYCGLESDPSHNIAKSLFTDGQYGPLLGVNIKTTAAGCQRICRDVSKWSNSTAYGAVFSQVEHRYEAEYCISQSCENYLRLSVGLEPAEELIEDLFQAIEKAVESDSEAA